MKSPLRAAAERHPVATYAFSWSVFIPFALKKHGIIQFPLSFSWYYCAAYAPLLGAIIPGFLPGLLAGAIVFTWLYNSTGGSILMLIIWHGVFNFVTGSKARLGLPRQSSVRSSWPGRSFLCLCSSRRTFPTGRSRYVEPSRPLARPVDLGQRMRG